MSKEEKILAFDPNGMATGDQFFGLPFDEEESTIVILPVPWEVTVSYGSGTARAPKAILEASRQVDLYDADVADAWKQGIFMKPIDKGIQKQSKQLRRKAVKYISFLEEESDQSGDKEMLRIRNQINKAGASLKDWVKKEIIALLQKKKIPGLLGGDHSTPLGFMEALAEFYPEYGILQIDAHCDLRDAYEGFEFSHASIMFNALKIPQIRKLVQVGIRDVAQSEMEIIHASEGRIKTFFDSDMKRSMYEGESWKEICDQIVNQLPPCVYISFDIDGLDPKLCPSSGTPVAGGLEFEQAVYLILKVVHSGRKIIGFDLNEVTPGNDEWDANVGARMLYKLCNFMGLSQRMFSSEESDSEDVTNDQEIIPVMKQKKLMEEIGSDDDTEID